jgi:hypothetical protein
MSFGNNPHPSGKTGWTQLSHREYDLRTWDYGEGNWSVTCNRQRVGPGTLGWIHRADGSHGHLAGLIVFTDVPQPQDEPGGTAYYGDGWLWRLPREWWIDGARVSAQHGWSGRALFGPTRRFRTAKNSGPTTVRSCTASSRRPAMD